MFEPENHSLEKVLQAYNRTEETFYEDVVKLREWMETQPHLPEIADNKMIKNFLLLNKCSIEKAKVKIDNYYTIRSVFPDIYDVANPERAENQKGMEISYWIALPKTTREMYRVIISKVRNKAEIDVQDPVAVLCNSINLHEIRVHEDTMIGDILIFDMEGVTLGHLLKLTPSFHYKSISIYEKVYSIPVKGIYIINALSLMDTVLKLLKGLLKPKIFERIHIHQDSKILFEIFPKEMIPKDFGGEEKSLEELREVQIKKFAEYKHRFDKLDTMKVDESLRPEKLKDDEFLGFHGNFKKLSID